MKTLIYTLLAWCVALMPIVAYGQTESKIYVGESTYVYASTVADLIHLNDEHVMSVQAMSSGSQYDALLLREFDACGLVRQDQISLDHLYGIGSVRATKVVGDSVLLVGRANPETHSFNEAFLMTMDRETFNGSYRYFRARQGSLFFDIDVLPNGQLVLLGFNSSTGSVPSAYFVMILNPDYSVAFAREFLGGFAFSGSIKYLPTNELFIRTAQQIFVTDLELNVRWQKAFTRNVAGNKVYVDDDGIIMPLYGWYGSSDVQVMKMDYDGNVVWRTPQFNDLLDNPAALQLGQRSDNTYVLALQSYEHQSFTGDIAMIEIDNLGNVLSQQAIRPYPSINFQFFKGLVVTAGANWVMTRSNQAGPIIYRADEMFDICGLDDYTFENSDQPEWFTAAQNYPLTPVEFEIGTIPFESQSNAGAVTEFCERIYPVYDILPDEVELCSGFTYSVDLDTIAEEVFWSDGFMGKYRAIDTPGIYGYGYGACETEIAEWITVKEKDCSCELYIPSAFSPNNDGVNDRFEIFLPCEYDVENALQVYDRWGGLVFSASGEAVSWNGEVDGKAASSGTYVYEFSYRNEALPGVPIIKRQGEVVLMR